MIDHHDLEKWLRLTKQSITDFFELEYFFVIRVLMECTFW